MIVAYVRVSTILQNEARQLELIKQEQCDKVFIEKLSGSKAENRPQLNAMLDYVREGDTIICHSIDRLARNHRDLCEILNICKDKGVIVRFLSQGLDTSKGVVTDMLISILGYVAQMELAHIKERQLEGIAIQKAKGTLKSGRPFINVDKAAFDEAFFASGGSITKTAKLMKISRTKLYKWLQGQKGTPQTA
ncbi:recombinase family protein [uncultured Helicobacter sp.]|uniref:recombinase family protein n=1 Tax=uncultured Helicobacter sp. TaxID=175537 RepID=UPI0026357DAD|nr:recombinase family protein [uncultured Helicobacter sp.]